jgi:predicted transcriptional regulator
MATTPKQAAQETLESLPEDCSFEDIEYHLFVRARIEEGLRDVEEGRVVSHEEVKRMVEMWREK